MRMRYRRIQIFLPFLIIALICSSSYGQDVVRVKRVIDGDTLLLANDERVRLIGVDTPETQHPQKPVEHFGKEAYLFTKRTVEGKEVRLEYDWQRKDRHGRLLAYVYLMDGDFLNAEIIKQGYGFTYTKYPRLSIWRSLGGMNGRRGRMGGGYGKRIKA